mgnify:CR=1 FL=1
MNAVDATVRAKTVRVELGSRSYDILIGGQLLGQTGRLLAERFPKARVAIVTDRTVAKLHLQTLAGGLDEAGIAYLEVPVAPGEASKDFATLEAVVDAILGGRLERGDLVVALGGGVVGDLAGFAAAVVRRGMRVIQIPTTLLAQVDSSVGGKTGINSRHGKNLIGAFHQPSLVIADSDVLSTLSPRHFRAGYAEVAKYGLLGDAGFFEWLESHWRAVFAGGEERVTAIARSCAAKAGIVSRDETEQGERALLNLGHTFGHALEAAAGYSDRLIHGEAVALGMVLAHDFSVEQALCPPDDARRVTAHLSAVGLPTRLADIAGGPPPLAQLMTLIAQDKKVQRGRLTFILSHGIGKAFVARDIPAERVETFLAEQLAA